MVIVTPAELDISGADEVHEALCSVISGSATTIIVDMTGTTFCDCAGVGVVLRAHQRAVASRAELRVAIATPLVRRVFALTGADQVIDVHPDVASALRGRATPAGSAG